jgi:hypothetical protein
MDDLLTVAIGWLVNGFGVIPCQPNTKRVVSGFGLRSDVIKETERVKFWFEGKKVNLAVVCPPDLVVLDFDQPDLYNKFILVHPNIASSYTERTPRGGSHIWVKLLYPCRIIPVNGLEVKKVVLVYPSEVSGRGYKVIGGGIESVNPEVDLIEFAQVERVRIKAGAGGISIALPEKRINPDYPLIQEVKDCWGLLKYFEVFEPDLILTGLGRWRSGLCPWHGDIHPSLWVDTERNIWGCHACSAHGDVINWHALRFGFCSPLESARDLMKKENGLRTIEGPRGRG